MYLLDTNIVVFYFRGNEKVVKKIKEIGFKNCFISEITIAELLVGARKSNNFKMHREILNYFEEKIQIIKIENIIDTYAIERARLEKLGTRIEDFDLLIGATAIANELILVTNNTKHLERMSIQKMEDWTK